VAVIAIDEEALPAQQVHQARQRRIAAQRRDVEDAAGRQMRRVGNWSITVASSANSRGQAASSSPSSSISLSMSAATLSIALAKPPIL